MLDGIWASKPEAVQVPTRGFAAGNALPSAIGARRLSALSMNVVLGQHDDKALLDLANDVIAIRRVEGSPTGAECESAGANLLSYHHAIDGLSEQLTMRFAQTEDVDAQAAHLTVLKELLPQAGNDVKARAIVELLDSPLAEVGHTPWIATRRDEPTALRTQVLQLISSLATTLGIRDAADVYLRLISAKNWYSSALAKKCLQTMPINRDMAEVLKASSRAFQDAGVDALVPRLRTESAQTRDMVLSIVPVEGREFINREAVGRLHILGAALHEAAALPTGDELRKYFANRGRNEAVAWKRHGMGRRSPSVHAGLQKIADGLTALGRD